MLLDIFPLEKEENLYPAHRSHPLSSRLFSGDLTLHLLLTQELLFILAPNSLLSFLTHLFWPETHSPACFFVLFCFKKRQKTKQHMGILNQCPQITYLVQIFQGLLIDVTLRRRF